MTENQKDTAKDIGQVESVAVQRTGTTALIVAQAEIDSQIATAKRFPRNIDLFRNDTQKMATRDAETAASCFYTIPRAGKNIMGPSIRLMEIALSNYGNCLAQCDVSHMDDRFIYAVGMCRDLEKNISFKQTVRRRITNKHGVLFNDDMIQITGAAASSVALRNAIMRVIPRAYIDPIYKECMAIAVGKAETMANTRAKAMEALAKMGADEARVLAALDLKSVEDIGRTEIAELRGAFTAIHDGESELDELFPEPKAAEEEAAEKVGNVAKEVVKDKPKTTKKTTKKVKKKSNLF